MTTSSMQTCRAQWQRSKGSPWVLLEVGGISMAQQARLVPKASAVRQLMSLIVLVLDQWPFWKMSGQGGEGRKQPQLLARPWSP